ncbi:MAG TPA: ABC transporter permease [Baekduia sp.]|nr:ABC transporter permease [Baekduia sp.]
MESGTLPSDPVEDAVAASEKGRREFNPERHVYEPHRVGLPPMGAYLREVWRRRSFAYEMSRTTLRAQHFKTGLGQLWLVLNPLLLCAVYFMLVDIVRHGNRPPNYFAHLVAALFFYHYYSGAVNQSARSVIGGGRLVLNTAFPRTLLPLSSVLTAFKRFLPTLLIYAVVHVASGLPIGLHLIMAIPVILLLTAFTAGMAMLVSAAQVYFRDVASFLPYILRIWMYATPVLYFVEDVPDRYHWLLDINPLTPFFGAWSDMLDLGLWPSATDLLWALGSATVAVVVGGLFFISREREFAVRL